MNRKPDQDPDDRAKDSILARVATFIDPKYRDNFWDFIVTWASRLNPADRLLRIIEALGYMVLSVQGIPQKLAEERARFEQALEEADIRRAELMRDMDSLTEKNLGLLNKVTRELQKERASYEDAFEKSVQRLEEKFDKKLAMLPKEVADALVASTVHEIRCGLQSLQNYRSLIYVGVGTVIFLAGIWFGHLR